MGSLKIKFSFLLFALLGVFFVNAQEASVEKLIIKEFTKEANQLIWHINYNIENLSNYQASLNTWYAAGETQTKDAPSFVFSENESSESFKQLISESGVQPSNPAFNYLQTLQSLDKQIMLFNSFCKQLASNQKTGKKEDYYARSMNILFQIDEMAVEMVNLCYDFSLSCAINFGKEKLPIELDKLKTTVGQSKNVIMAIRENSPIQLKSYLNQLNLAILASNKNERFNDLKRIGKFDIDEASLKKLQDQILASANEIAFWAEQYLQSNKTDAEVITILSSAIRAFNVSPDGEVGCSGAYNEMVSHADVQYLSYTEEPMFFKIEKEQKGAESVELKVKNDTILVEAVEQPAIVKVEEVSTPLVFDEFDINSLDGALPNNIIIMMDVSASMKLTGKLPLLKASIEHLLDIMRPEDRISLIAYSGKSELLIKDAGIHNRGEVKAVLDTLHSSGGTDIKNGVMLGYHTALESFMQEGNNRIIIATDGEFGVRKDLLTYVQEKSLTKVVLSIFQFNESKNAEINPSLQLLAETGRGNYKMIANSQEALEVLMSEVKKK